MLGLRTRAALDIRPPLPDQKRRRVLAPGVGGNEPLHRTFVEVAGTNFEKLTVAALDAGLPFDELRRFLLHGHGRLSRHCVSSEAHSSR